MWGHLEGTAEERGIQGYLGGPKWKKPFGRCRHR